MMASATTFTKASESAAAVRKMATSNAEVSCKKYIEISAKNCNKPIRII
jgi:hypothetical protein